MLCSVIDNLLSPLNKLAKEAPALEPLVLSTAMIKFRKEGADLAASDSITTMIIRLVAAATDFVDGKLGDGKQVSSRSSIRSRSNSSSRQAALMQSVANAAVADSSQVILDDDDDGDEDELAKKRPKKSHDAGSRSPSDASNP